MSMLFDSSITSGMSLRLRRRRRHLEISSAPTTRTRKTQARYNCPRAKKTMKTSKQLKNLGKKQRGI